MLEIKKNLSMEITLNRIVVGSDRSIKFYNFEDIVFCEGSGNYTRFYLSNGVITEYYSMQIGLLYSRIDELGFFRISRNQIVNLQQVQEVIKGRPTKLSFPMDAFSQFHKDV